MGCGCRKAKNNRAARVKALEQANRVKKAASKATPITSKSAAIPDKFIHAMKVKRLAICEKCPYSAQTKEEKKNGQKICHKVNRHTFAIASNAQFKCPKKKF